MENLRFEKDAAVQRAVQSSADEIQQLKGTIASLRSEMESNKKSRHKKLRTLIDNNLLNPSVNFLKEGNIMLESISKTMDLEDLKKQLEKLEKNLGVQNYYCQ